MKLPRRNFLHLAAGVAALPAVSQIAKAQSYRTRPVRWIVPFGPAGATDITARLIGQWLSERLGQQFVIENRPGAGGNVGTEAVVRAPADGYTLLFVNTANAISTTLYEKLNFNFVRDIAPIAPIVRFPYIMVVNPSVPRKTLPEFIAFMLPAPRQKQPRISPIFISDKVTLHVSREKDGKSGLLYAQIGRFQNRPASRGACAAVPRRYV